MLLASAVFAWGLHYKLTLYRASTQVEVRQPAAKLLSQRERAQAQQPSVQNTQTLLPAGSLLILLFAFVLPQAPFTSWQISADPACRCAMQYFASGSFIRPPPQVAEIRL